MPAAGLFSMALAAADISGWLGAGRRPVDTRGRAGLRPIAGNRPRVAGHALFHDALLREHRRAVRHGTAFVVLLVEVLETDEVSSAPVWSAVARAMAAARRRTDLLGWFEPGTVLGLMLAEVSADAADVAARVEARVRLQLAATRLDEASLARVSVRRYASAVAPDDTAASGVSPIQPLLLELPRPRGTRLHLAGKRALDILGSLAALVMLSPVFAVVAGLVKLTSRGPVFFRQERIGEGGRPFRMIKFRTMRHGAGHALHQQYVTWFIQASDRQREAAPDGIFKLQRDPRVTPIGRFLRRTSLDELPQFWNVLVGEMSLVGPRPPLPFEVEQYQPWHRRRVLDARPGITGLWQVTGRSRTTFDEMVRLDLRYAKAPSIWTDLRILAATPRAVISGKGAC